MPVRPHDRFDTVYLHNAVGQLITQLSNLSHTLEVPAEDIWAEVIDHPKGVGSFPSPVISNIARATVCGLLAINLTKPNNLRAYNVTWDEIERHPNFDSWEEPS